MEYNEHEILLKLQKATITAIIVQHDIVFNLNNNRNQ